MWIVGLLDGILGADIACNDTGLEAGKGRYGLFSSMWPRFSNVRPLLTAVWGLVLTFAGAGQTAPQQPFQRPLA